MEGVVDFDTVATGFVVGPVAAWWVASPFAHASAAAKVSGFLANFPGISVYQTIVYHRAFQAAVTSASNLTPITVVTAISATAILRSMCSSPKEKESAAIYCEPSGNEEKVDSDWELISLDDLSDADCPASSLGNAS